VILVPRGSINLLPEVDECGTNCVITCEMRSRFGFLLPAATGWFLCISLCVLQGCISVDRVGTRKFATQEAAVAQFRAHEQAYLQLAEEWLRSGQQEFCRFGSDDYKWNEYWIRSAGSAREVMHWDGKEHVKQPASSFDEAARLAGVGPAIVRYWMQQTSSLSVDCISRREVTLKSQKSDYVEIGFFPVTRPYGFRFAPENDLVSHEALALWVARTTQQPFHRLVSLGGPWFYFEGYWRSPLLPLSQVSGAVRDHEGMPAVGVRVDLARARDDGQMDWPNETRTDSDGRFRFPELTAGNYLLGINLRESPSADVPYPRTYYPGIGDRQQATALDVQEMSNLVVRPLSLPSRLAERRVAVQVVWPDGSPALDARVCRQTSEDALCMPMDQVGDQPGVYGFAGVAGVEYKVSASVQHGIGLLFVVFSQTPSYADPIQIPLADSTTPVRLTLNCEGYPDGRHTCR
jgi:hypothetical protein